MPELKKSTIKPPDSPYLSLIPLDSDTIEQPLLNIENKQRSNLFPWAGQFSPQLVEVLLTQYCSDGFVVLDPFAGSGTTLGECGRKGVHAHAVEINPAAFSMARTYELVNQRSSERWETISRIAQTLRKAFSKPPPLFEAESGREEASFQALLMEACSALDDPRSVALFETLIVLSDFYKPGLDQRRLMGTWNKLVSLVCGLPYSSAPLRAINGDARQLPLAPQSVDLVITSPPYINVFNYHQQYRASAEALGWNLLNVAKSEIGSNRKNRGNRFLTVIQYCLDIAAALLELSRVCKPSGRIIFVVGRESKVRGTPMLNGNIVALLATRCLGFHLQSRQERVFKNKFGAMIVEDILHFTGIAKLEDPILDPRIIGMQVLKSAFQLAPANAATDLTEAIDRAHEVRPSPIYEPNAARRDGAGRAVQPISPCQHI